jgi:hypothetical protein
VRAWFSHILSGSGDLNPDYILKQLPSMLSLEEKKINPIVKELVASRKRMLLVQAVSQFRQKRPAETVGARCSRDGRCQVQPPP